TRVVGIAPLQGNGSCPARPWLPPIFGLRHVEIICLGGRKHDVISLLGERDATCRSLPSHKIGVPSVNAGPQRCFLPGSGTTAERVDHLLEVSRAKRLLALHRRRHESKARGTDERLRRTPLAEDRTSCGPPD